MSDRLVTVWALVRWARCSGEFVDDFAVAALIDAEVELEGLLEDAATGSVVEPAELGRVAAAERALALAADEPRVPPVVHGWLRAAIDLAGS